LQGVYSYEGSIPFTRSNLYWGFSIGVIFSDRLVTIGPWLNLNSRSRKRYGGSIVRILHDPLRLPIPEGFDAANSDFKAHLKKPRGNRKELTWNTTHFSSSITSVPNECVLVHVYYGLFRSRLLNWVGSVFCVFERVRKQKINQEGSGELGFGRQAI
jgi:hypothetical protein